MENALDEFDRIRHDEGPMSAFSFLFECNEEKLKYIAENTHLHVILNISRELVYYAELQEFAEKICLMICKLFKIKFMEKNILETFLKNFDASKYNCSTMDIICLIRALAFKKAEAVDLIKLIEDAYMKGRNGKKMNFMSVSGVFGLDLNGNSYLDEMKKMIPTQDPLSISEKDFISMIFLLQVNPDNDGAIETLLYDLLKRGEKNLSFYNKRHLGKFYTGLFSSQTERGVVMRAKLGDYLLSINSII